MFGDVTLTTEAVSTDVEGVANAASSIIVALQPWPVTVVQSRSRDLFSATCITPVGEELKFVQETVSEQTIEC